MTRFEKFYGFTFSMDDYVDINSYKTRLPALKSAIEKALEEEAETRKMDSCKVYVAKMQFVVTRKTHWGVGQLRDRIRDFKCYLRVNQKVREKSGIVFLNKRIPSTQWLLTPNIDVRPSLFEIRCWVSGVWFAPLDEREENYVAELLLIAAVDPSVPDRQRKIKVHASARPTAQFARKFKTADESAMEITYDDDYHLGPDVQLDVFRNYGQGFEVVRS